MRRAEARRRAAEDDDLNPTSEGWTKPTRAENSREVADEAGETGGTRPRESLRGESPGVSFVVYGSIPGSSPSPRRALSTALAARRAGVRISASGQARPWRPRCPGEGRWIPSAAIQSWLESPGGAIRTPRPSADCRPNLWRVRVQRRRRADVHQPRLLVPRPRRATPWVSTRQSSSTLLSSSPPKQRTSWLCEMGLAWLWECSHLRVLTCCRRTRSPSLSGSPTLHEPPCGEHRPVRVGVVRLGKTRTAGRCRCRTRLRERLGRADEESETTGEGSRTGAIDRRIGSNVDAIASRRRHRTRSGSRGRRARRRTRCRGCAVWPWCRRAGA